jgi:flavin-dependent thymidylate synthase
VEFAGKLCYRAWKPGLNPNVTKVRNDQAAYIRNILDSGHGCYDAETDVLTERGWVAWPDVKSTDRFATRTASGQLEYHYATKLVAYKHKGSMYRVDARGVDLLVTPDHKMLACPTTTKHGRKKQDYALIPATELGERSHAYIKTATWSGGAEVITPDEAAMLGFAIGDGYFEKGLQFHLRRPRKIKWLRERAAALGWSLRENDDHYNVTVPEDLLKLFAGIYTSEGEKQIPPGLLTEASKPVLQGLLDGLMESDGHRGRTGNSYDTTSDVLAGQFLHLALAVGKAANICYRREDRSNSFGNKPLTRLSLIGRELRPEINKFEGGTGRGYIVPEWEGYVYCAEVPNHTLYVRRNGKTVWSGNSVLEHANFSFVFSNVSRVMTHELVRHRAGSAFSQESMRFVRLNDIPFWLPDWAQEDAVLAEECLQVLHILECHQLWMAKHLGLDEPGVPFSEKKAKTSFMRRFAPEGVATSIVWTANVRTLRNVIEQRTSPHAEEEIRLVFDKVMQIMQDECPLFFQDFTPIEQEGGATEWRSENRKV